MFLRGKTSWWHLLIRPLKSRKLRTLLQRKEILFDSYQIFQSRIYPKLILFEINQQISNIYMVIVCGNAIEKSNLTELRSKMAQTNEDYLDTCWTYWNPNTFKLWLFCANIALHLQILNSPLTIKHKMKLIVITSEIHVDPK